MKKLSDAECQAVLEAAARYQTVAEAAASLDLHPNTFTSRRKVALERLGPINDAPKIVPTASEPLPPANLDPVELIGIRKRQFAAKVSHHSALQWRRYQVPIEGPYALMFFGDPHLDDDGCNIELFDKHAELAASTKGLFAINIGDSTNNWVGRLMGLYAEQEAGKATAKALVKHYMIDRGVPWFIWLLGNHDMWPGPVSGDYFHSIKPEFVQMHDWQAKVRIASPNGHELKLWAAHNFKGNSIWNNMHGLLRAALLNDSADLLVGGHHHDNGLVQGENPFRAGHIFNLMRVRGYKFMDHYAELHQFGEYQHGAAGVAVVDPSAGHGPNAVSCFLDPFEAVDFLQFKRRRLAA